MRIGAVAVALMTLIGVGGITSCDEFDYSSEDRLGPRPSFSLPFACDSSWGPTVVTYEHGEEYLGGVVGSAWRHENSVDFGKPAYASAVPVLASAPGFARLTGNPSEGVVRVDHDSGWSSNYGHLTGISVGAAGRQVARGEVLGYVTVTLGTSTGPHLHYQQLAAGIVEPSVFDGQTYAWSAPSNQWDGNFKFYGYRHATNTLRSKNCGRATRR